MEDMSQNRFRKPTNITLDPELLAALDEWIARQEIKTSRSAVLDALIRKFLADQKRGARNG